MLQLEFLLSKIDLPYRYATVASFLACLTIQEALSPWLSRLMTSSYAQLSPVQQVEWDNRIMSIAHALTASFLSLLAFFCDEGLTPDAVRYDSHIVLLGSAILLGYALADLFETCMRPRALWTTDMVFHHVICCCIPCVYFMYRCAPYYGNIGWMAEISSPFLHIRRLLMMTGSKKTSQAYKVNGILFVMTFFVFRIAVIPWFWHNWLFRLTMNPEYYLPENAVPLNTSLSEGIIMNVLNSYWFVRLCIVTWRHLSLSKDHDD
ncbi:TLC domain-containing protein 4-A-like [Branchiostoma lanceolatum]|uniref:TLC domain-containing protein 4-A-like n=1 Tax=Branchiostoma lanceolatum TaxID=7740 RepID=UPI003455C036